MNPCKQNGINMVFRGFREHFWQLGEREKEDRLGRAFLHQSRYNQVYQGSRASRKLLKRDLGDVHGRSLNVVPNMGDKA